MFFKHSSLLLILCYTLYQPARAEPTLTISPTTCVTLQQGRECHAQMQAEWQLPQPDPVCLYLDEQQLECWHNAVTAKRQWRFTDTQSRQLTLWKMTTDGQQDIILATARVEVSWVQSAHKKRSWRRF